LFHIQEDFFDSEVKAFVIFIHVEPLKWVTKSPRGRNRTKIEHPCLMLIWQTYTLKQMWQFCI